MTIKKPTYLLDLEKIIKEAPKDDDEIRDDNDIPYLPSEGTEKDKEEAKNNRPNFIEEMNKKHAAIKGPGKFQILTERENAISLQSKKDFIDCYENKPVGEKGKTKGTEWLKHPDRREYEKITFKPYNPHTPNGRKINQENATDEYNLWKGFAFKPKHGDVSIFKEFVLKVICNGDEKHFNYLYSWIARLVQFPEKQGETAIILMGKQGTGKNTFVETIGALFGVHYKPLSSIEELLGRFDFHHANAILIHANESLWGGDKRRIGKLKTLITEPEVTVEQKFKDPVTLKNCRHLIFSSNEDWPVHLDFDDRRFLILNLSDCKKEDKGYFRQIRDWGGNGGYEALLHDLNTYDLSDFNVRNVPQSKKSLDVKLRSHSNEYTYIYEVLIEGNFILHAHNEIESSSTSFGGDILKKDAYKHYISWCDTQKTKDVTGDSLFWKSWKKLIPSTNTGIIIQDDGMRKRCARFPCLEQARKEFENSLKLEGLVSWSPD